MGRDCYRVNGICVGFHYKFAGDYNADLKGVKIGSSVSDIEKTFGYNYLHFQNNYNYSLEDVDIFFYVDEYSGRVSNFGVYFNVFVGACLNINVFNYFCLRLIYFILKTAKSPPVSIGVGSVQSKYVHEKVSVWCSATQRYVVLDFEVEPSHMDFYFYAHD